MFALRAHADCRSAAAARVLPPSRRRAAFYFHVLTLARASLLSLPPRFPQVERNNGRAAMMGITGMMIHNALGVDALFPIVQ